MSEVFCRDCKFAPDNLVWADYCKKKKGEKYIESYIVGIYVKRRDANEGNNCKYYKSSLQKKLVNLIDKIFKS